MTDLKLEEVFDADVATARELLPGLTDGVVRSARQVLHHSAPPRGVIDKGQLLSHLERVWRIVDKPPWNSRPSAAKIAAGLLGNRAWSSWYWNVLEELDRAVLDYFHARGPKGYRQLAANAAFLRGWGEALGAYQWNDSHGKIAARAATYELLRPAYARRFTDNPLKPLLYFEAFEVSFGYSQVRVTPGYEAPSPTLVGEGPAWLDVRNKVGAFSFPESIWTRPDKITAHDIFRIGNIERRRTLIEWLGYDRFVKRVNPNFYKKDKYGQILAVPARGDTEDMVLVHVKDASTPREYYLRVPPDFVEKTPKAAVAWSFRENSATYKPQVQT